MSVVRVERDDARRSLVLIARFDAPIERVWRLWADPRQLERWWGPPTHPSTVERHDLVPGGEVTYSMTGPEGGTSRGWWRVTPVDPPRSLEFTEGLSHPDGTPNPGAPIIAVRMRLTEGPGGTRMELLFVFESREHMRRVERGGAFEVFPRSVAQMDAVLATRAPAPVATSHTKELTWDGS